MLTGINNLTMISSCRTWHTPGLDVPGSIEGSWSVLKDRVLLGQLLLLTQEVLLSTWGLS